MGKRKSSKKAPPKPSTTPLSSTFKCLFCHHDKSVNVKLDKQTMFGHLNCKTCGQRYQAPINNLSAAVDVYCDWVDACEEIRLKQPKKQRAPRGPDPLLHGAQGGATFSLTDRAHPHGAADDELDAEGEDDEDVEPEDLAGMLNKEKARRKAVDDDDDDLDADDRDADRGKRRRVADYDDDDDDDE